MRSIVVCLAAALGTASALAQTPAPLLDPAAALDGKHDGSAVLWGGRVFAQAADVGAHCLEIGALPLRSSDGRPMRRDRVREGQHFIACGPDAFGSAEHPVRSYLTVAGTVRHVERRFVRRRCGYLIDASGHRDTSSAREPANDGCTVLLPVVDVDDTRAWREDPTPASMPAF